MFKLESYIRMAKMKTEGRKWKLKLDRKLSVNYPDIKDKIMRKS